MTRRWTQSALTELRARTARGETLVQIAEALARPTDEIGDMAQRLRLRRAAMAQDVAR